MSDASCLTPDSVYAIIDDCHFPTNPSGASEALVTGV